MDYPRIVVVGSMNVDLVVKSARLPTPGETVIGGDFHEVHGGKGANQAVALARLGANCSMIAKVGSDRFGDDALEELAGEGLDVDQVTRAAHLKTGVAIIAIDERGENQISVASGANAALLPEDIDRAAGLLRHADMLVVQLEVPLATVKHALEMARAAGVRTLLDPAPVPAGGVDDAILSLVDYLKPNETEAEQLTGIKVLDEVTACRAAAELRRRGARHVVITLGGQGAVCDDGQLVRLVPGEEVATVDTTAAGDAFSAGLAVALARGQALDRAVAYANLVGALTVTRLGAHTSLPTAAEVLAFAEARGLKL
ncbi:MAG: ribokinase [Planctomycetes bacterium]|nr:ribokinase [Planctomycetota bacterium]